VHVPAQRCTGSEWRAATGDTAAAENDGRRGDKRAMRISQSCDRHAAITDIRCRRVRSCASATRRARTSASHQLCSSYCAGASRVAPRRACDAVAGPTFADRRSELRRRSGTRCRSNLSGAGPRLARALLAEGSLRGACAGSPGYRRTGGPGSGSRSSVQSCRAIVRCCGSLITGQSRSGCQDARSPGAQYLCGARESWPVGAQRRRRTQRPLRIPLRRPAPQRG
jgi:hypothetical protein